MVTGIFAAIAAIGTIFGVFKYWTQLTVWLSKKSLDQKNQDIDKSVSDEQKQVDSGGRPQWK